MTLIRALGSTGLMTGYVAYTIIAGPNLEAVDVRLTRKEEAVMRNQLFCRV
jgi:hypothetical protein